MLYYHDGLTDYYMKHNLSDPRYGFLARKAISYYLGDLYNPETFDYGLEVFIRRLIKSYVELKVFDKQPYDWPFIDNFLRYTLNDAGFKHIEYDMDIIMKGYNGVMRGELPTHCA